MHIEIGRILWLSVLLSFGGVWRIRVALLFLYPVLLARGRSVSVLSDVTYRAAIYEGRSINIYRGK